MPNKPLESASRGMLKRLAAAHIPQPCCTKAPMGTCALSLGALRIDRTAARFCARLQRSDLLCHCLDALSRCIDLLRMQRFIERKPR